MDTETPPLTHSGNRARVGMLLGTRGALLNAERSGGAPNAQLLVTLAEHAEAAGLDSVWVGDSLVSKPRFEPVTTLAALAARTRRLRLGTSVLLPTLRQPVALAHSLATLDVLSEGRLVIGAGVGGAFTPEQRQDFLVAGTPPRTRASRLEETIQLMKQLWSGKSVTFRGEHFWISNVTLRPTPVQPGGPPVLLATHYRTGSTAQFSRTARFADGVIGISDAPSEFGEVLHRVDELAMSEGRDAALLERAFYLTVHISDDTVAAAAEADEFLMAYYGVRHWTGRWGPWGPAEEVAQAMAAYTRVGVQELIVRFASWDQKVQLERFVAEVLPRFRSLES